MLEALRFEGVTAGYGATVAIEDIDFALDEGKCAGIIGRNGMGKTSLLGTVVDRTSLHRGRVLFEGRDISGLPMHQRARLGIALVPQEREIFPSLTVFEKILRSAPTRESGRLNASSACSRG